MVMISIHRRPVFIVLMKDETSTPVYKEKFNSLSDATKESDRIAFEYPRAQVILMRQEGDAVQVLYTVPSILPKA